MAEMSERLTETLVRQGQLSPEAAQAAVERQVLMGGALDTALLEIGVEESLVLSAFREAYDTPAADLTEVEAAVDERAVRAIPEQWARRHRLAPLSMDDGGHTLTVLSPAPPDLELLVRLSELLELEVKPRLALESQVVQRLCRVYGTRPPDRFVSLVTQRPAGGTPLEPLPFSKAVEALRRAEQRDQIARALLGFALRELAFGALFVVESAELRGWLGFGPGAHVVADRKVPIVEPSAYRMVIDSQGHYLGPRPEDRTQLEISRSFGRQQPRTVVLAPIRLKGRTVALLYGENGPDPIPGRLAGDLMLLVTHVQTALEQLVLRRKHDAELEIGSPPGHHPAGDGNLDAMASEPPMTPELAESEPPAPGETSAAHQLPDEPIYSEDSDEDDDWEPVAVARANFVEGVELMAPEVVPTDSELPDPQTAVVTAPRSSRDMPHLAWDSDPSAEMPAPDRSADPPVPELVPRTVQRVESADVPVHEAEYPTEEDPVVWATTASGSPGTAPTEADLGDRAITEPASNGPQPAPSPEATTEDLEDQLWEEEGRGLAERLLGDESEDGVPSDLQWDVVEPSSWSEPNLEPLPGGADESPSQPVLLTDRLSEAPTPAEPAPTQSLVPDHSEVDALVRKLTDEDEDADERLLELGPRILARLTEHFPGPGAVDPFQRRTVPPFEDCGPLLAVFNRFGRMAHPHVAQCLENKDPKVRFYATHFYSGTQVPEAIPRLIQRLHDEEPRICMVAARTLFGYRDHPDFSFVLDHLHGRLQATSHAARRHAAYLIGLFRDVTAIPKLIEILERKEKSMMDVAQDALADITKQRLGNNPRRWRVWLERNRERSRVLWLIDGLSSKEESIRKSAAEELRAVTRKDFGFEHDAPRRRREEARQRWLQWWEREGQVQLGGG